MNTQETAESAEFQADVTKPQKGFHWLIAAPMSLWCLIWLLVNGYNYIHLTWRLFANLGWLSFVLIVNPCFLIWLGFFSSSAWAPLNFLSLPWGKYGPEINRWKIFGLVVFVPVLLNLLTQYIGPYFYPITYGGESGNRIFLRFIPILGGKGF